MAKSRRALIDLLLATSLLTPTAFVPAAQNQATIATTAGGDVGDGRPAAEALLNHPDDVVADAQGNIYFTEEFYERVRRIDAASGTITTVAGNGITGFSGDDGPAARANLNKPEGLAIDTGGNLYIADFNNHRIRRVDARTGIITTFAGDGFKDAASGLGRFSGDDGPATRASLDRPIGLAFDPAGNLFIGDFGNNRIRKVDARTRIITTFAGNGRDSADPNYTGPAIGASLKPAGLAFDPSGRLYVADFPNHLVVRIDGSTGMLVTVAGDGFKVACDLMDPVTCFRPPAGILGTGRFNVETGPARRVSLNFPQDVAIDGQGNVYIADRSNHRIRRLSMNSQLTTIAGSGAFDRLLGVAGGFAGDGGPAPMAKLSRPTGVAVDPSGNILIADFDNDRIRMINFSGTITTRAGGPLSFGDGGVATEAGVYVPEALATDNDGNIFLAEPAASYVRRVDSRGVITRVAGNGKIEFSEDGRLATEVGLGGARGLAVDSSDNLYIAEFLGMRVRRVDRSSGIITTIAGSGMSGFAGDGGPATGAQMSFPVGLAMDADDNLFVADSSNHRIRRVDARTGVITTVVGNGFSPNPDNPGDFAGDGGLATAASLRLPLAVAVDRMGNIIIADTGNQRVRLVDGRTRIINTIAGDGFPGDSGDGGAARAARFRNPTGVAVDATGNIFVVDTGNNRIRLIDKATGRISTVAGSGKIGFSGDGGPATGASLRGPFGIAVRPDGTFFVSDSFNHRLRRVG